VEVSKRISYYGNVMDALVQQHPEYVSLAWGTMKLVFGVFDFLTCAIGCTDVDRLWSRMKN